jgi:ankyrin repeat protein
MSITSSVIKEFFKAIKSNNISQVCELIRANNINVNETFNEENFARTAVHEAAAQGSLKLIQELVEKHGANINFPDDVGDLPIHSAVESFHMDVVDYLLKHGSQGAQHIQDFLLKYKPPQQLESKSD